MDKRREGFLMRRGRAGLEGGRGLATVSDGVEGAEGEMRHVRMGLVVSTISYEWYNRLLSPYLEICFSFCSL